MAMLPIPYGRSPSVAQSRARRRDEEGTEEEAEVWAALERLPTYDYMRRTIIEKEIEERKVREQIEVKDVDLNQYLMNQVYKQNNPEEDVENFLTKLRHRIDEVGVSLPSVEVEYDNLTVEGEVYEGSRANPTLPNTVLNFLETLLSKLKILRARKKKLTILEGVTGTLKPGRLTLLLGPPAAGKSTFLLALAGQSDSKLKVNGTVKYNGYTLNEFEPRKTAAYISQDDLHQPELTVRETMYYSARFQGTGNRQDLIKTLFAKEKERGLESEHRRETDYFLKASASDDTAADLSTEYYLKIMGLDICAKTIVGDAMRRGISGGQRKRLTTAEMIVGPKRALFMDEISTGLDSSTTYQVVKCIGQATRIFETTTLISLLQPAPETFDLFDDIILLSGGHIVYQGPRETVAEFFESCGFVCPKRKAMPDFLQEVTSINDQEQYWADKSTPYEYVPVVEFVEHFKTFHVWNKIEKEMIEAQEKGKHDEGALEFNRWSLPQWELMKINFEKEVLIFKKNWFVPVFNLCQLATMSLLASSLFFRTEMHHRNLADAAKYSGALYFLLTQVLFLGYSELTFTAIRFPVFHKFREIYFFPPWTWALSSFLIKMPFAMLESLVGIAFTYYIMGFAPEAVRFLRLWLLLALANQMGSGLFRALAGFCRSFVIGTSVGGFSLAVIFMLGGFVITRNSIRGWWIWGYWAFPLSYVENGVLVNEYLAPRWNHRSTLSGGRTLGHRYILSMDMFDRGYWYWLAAGATAAYGALFFVLFALTITILDVPGRSQAQISKEQFARIHAQITGEGVEDLRTRASGRSMTRSISSAIKSSFRGLSQSRRSSSGISRTRSNLGSMEEGSTSAADRQPKMGEMPESELATTSSFAQKNGSPDSNRGSVSTASVDRPKKAVGMVLPFQPLAISFKDVQYYVPMPAGQRQSGGATELQLLRDITGSFRPGVLTALVGVSGAGKSTLMDVLAGRKTGGRVEGDIRISGFPKRQETFTRIAGYCEQNDIHAPQVTLYESLVFSAWLRLAPDIDDQTKYGFVDQVMGLVELTTLRDAIVGTPGESGLSTEQRKRLTIAVELVANPSIIFMDEPTSGLDAQAAATVMRTVRNTVDTGRTVVCTIHQPSIDIFDAFDELFLLKRGGQTIYAGSLGKHAFTLIDYFQGINGVPRIGDGVNPAAWMLIVTTPGMEDRLKADFAELYSNSDVAKTTNALVEQLSTPPPGTEDLNFPTVYAQPPWEQFKTCLWRQSLSYWRSPSYNLMRLLLNTAMGFFLGTLFWGMGKKLGTQQNVFSLLGAIYSAQMFIGVLTATSVQPLMAAERIVFYRERGAGIYSDYPYAFAHCAIEVPYVLSSIMTFVLLSYSMMKLDWAADKFFWYLYFISCSQLTFVYLGMMTVALTPTPETAAILATVGYNVWNLFGGFFVAKPLFPKWWKWAYWCDPLAYHIYGIIVSQLGTGSRSERLATTRGGKTMSVKDLIRTSYGYKHSYMPLVASMSFLFPILFAVGFVIFIKKLNYQQR